MVQKRYLPNRWILIQKGNISAKMINWKCWIATTLNKCFPAPSRVNFLQFVRLFLLLIAMLNRQYFKKYYFINLANIMKQIQAAFPLKGKPEEEPMEADDDDDEY